MPQKTIEVRGQLLGVLFLLPTYGFRDWTQIIRLKSKHLYPLSHMTSPNFVSWDRFSYIALLVRQDTCYYPLSAKMTGMHHHTHLHIHIVVFSLYARRFGQGDCIWASIEWLCPVPKGWCWGGQMVDVCFHSLPRVSRLLFLSACHCCWDQSGKRPSWSSVQAAACTSALGHAVSDSRGLLLAPSPDDSTWGFFSQSALRVFLSGRFSVSGSSS